MPNSPNTHSDNGNRGPNGAHYNSQNNTQNRTQNHFQTHATEDAHQGAYLEPIDHIRDRLALLSLQLHREVLLMRALRGDRQESFLGLFISEQDIEALLAELQGKVLQDFPGEERLQARMDRLSRAMEQRLAATQQPLPCQQLSQAFGLLPHEQDLLIMALAPELDPRFAKVYGYLHDDVARKHLSALLAQRLLALNDPAASALRRSLHPDQSLLKFQLLQLLDDNRQPLLTRALKLDNRIADFLLGLPQMDADLVDLMEAPWSAKLSLHSDASTESATSAGARWLHSPAPLVLEVPPHGDIDLWLSLFCGHSGLGLLCLSWPKLLALDPERAALCLRKALREAHLSNSLLHLRQVDTRAPQLLDLLGALATPLTCLSSNQPLALHSRAEAPLHLTLPPVSFANRLACWRAALPAEQPLSEPQLQACAERYPLPVRRLNTLCRTAHLGAGEQPFLEALRRSCRRELGEQMRSVAQPLDTPFGFGDLVLSSPTATALQELVARQSHHGRVLDTWGLGNLFQQSRGCAALFIGPSGTGKTMAAGVIARELGLDLCRVDLSGVVSKYIGETEKNLERIFSTAAQSQVVLFIDEADALFGKRSEVKDAHDRYANIEVSYLLQKMEDHPGLVVLASNFGQNIDDAFFRRFGAVVEFHLPSAEDRLRLWQRLERSQAPLADDIDLSFLAERFDISGGHIKNCILAAAYQAAAQGEAITMAMLVRAVSREYTKLGRPIGRNLFGDYYTALRRESSAGSCTSGN